MRHCFIANVVGPWQVEGGELYAPVTMMVEGVHAGSHGPIFWAAHVLKASVPKWEGIALTMNHPHEDGEFVSIGHSHAVRQRFSVGRVSNVHFDEQAKALKATIRVPANHPRILEIQGIREVSCGVFSTETQTYEPAEWRGEAYHACAIAMEPDHLALLPRGTRGACSWADGCGVRVNVSGEMRAAIIEAARDIMIQNSKGDQNMKERGTLVVPVVKQREVVVNEQEWEKVGLMPMTVHALLLKQKAAKREQEQKMGAGSLLPTQFNKGR